MSPTSQIIPDIVSVGTDVEPLAADNPEVDLGKSVPEDLVGVDVDEPGFALNRLALAGQLVKGNAVLLDGRDHRRGLVKIAVVFCKCRLNLLSIELRDRTRGGDLSVGIL